LNHAIVKWKWLPVKLIPWQPEARFGIIKGHRYAKNEFPQTRHEDRNSNRKQ
jgi:hypothetical protein